MHIDSLIKKEVGFEHLHLHSHFSVLDGYGYPEEYAKKAISQNQRFLTITDHGSLGSIPRQIQACDIYGTKPIFGIELYVNPLQPIDIPKSEFGSYLKSLNEYDQMIFKKSFHLLAIAYNEVGYKNLINLSSEGYTKGFYKKPRVNHDQLRQYKEGITFSSCCYIGEIGQAFDREGPDAANDMVEKYIDLFGKDNFVLEFMLLDFEKQKPYDEFIMEAHQRHGLELIVTNDCHYPDESDSTMQQLMLMSRSGKTISQVEELQSQNVELFELQDKNLWMKNELELNQKWYSDYREIIPYELFETAKLNTVKLCEKSAGVELDRSLKLPEIPDAKTVLINAVQKGVKERRIPLDKLYRDRITEEIDLIDRKGFCSYFLIQKMMVDEARRVMSTFYNSKNTSLATGPGRGCLSPNSYIITDDGTKPIEKVQEGDFVLNRDGKFRKVIKKFKYEVKEDLLNIKTYYGDNRGLGLTADHMIWAEKSTRPNGYDSWSEVTKKHEKSWKKPNEKLSWLRADSLKEGDWMFVPYVKCDLNEIKTIDLSQFCNGSNLICEGDYVLQKWLNPLTGSVRSIKKNNKVIDLDNDWWRLLGRFAGDGWWRLDGRSSVRYCFHSEDKTGLNLLIRKLDNLKISDYTINKHKNKKLIQVHINNKFILEFHKYFFDSYECTSQTKHIPSLVFEQSQISKEMFIRGYLGADGHDDLHKMKFSTTSESLAHGLRLLLWGLKIPSSINFNNRLDKRTNKKYVEITVNTPKNIKFGSNRDYEQNYHWIPIEDGIMQRIRSIEVLGNVSEVYDLKVDGSEENFCTTSGLVHNSAVGSLVCYCLGITNVDPIEHDLLFSRFLSPARGGKQMKLRFSIDPIATEEELGL